MKTTPDLNELHRAEQVAAAAFSDRSSGCTPRQLRVLSAVSAKNATQTEIVEASGVDRSTIADLCTRLAKKGLITRKRSKDDARANIIAITEKGKAVLASLDVAEQAAEQKIIGALPVNLRAPFIKALEHIAAPATAI
jgi:DNA-binding MarR family transcriptional regulator